MVHRAGNFESDITQDWVDISSFGFCTKGDVVDIVKKTTNKFRECKGLIQKTYVHSSMLPVT